LEEVIPVPLSMSNTALGAMIGGISGALGAIFGPAVSALIRAAMHYHRGLRPYVTIRAQSLSKAFLAIGPTIAFVFLLLFLPLLAAERADRVKEALPAAPVSFLGFPLLAVGAEPSNLVGDGGKRELAGCVLYLGSSDKNVVFFKRARNARSGTIVRIPASEVGGWASDVASSPIKTCWTKP